MKKYYIGVDVGGTSAKFGLYAEQGSEGNVEQKWSVPTTGKDASDVLLGKLADSIKEKCVEYNIDMSQVAGVGIGIPGPVDDKGVVLNCANLNFGIVPVKDIMKKLTGVDNVAVGNDANVAALGEMWKGGARGYTDIVMVTLGTGVGGGIVVDGKIHVGSAGAAAEIGHITVEPNETESCGCGCHGCLEQYASATGVVRLAKKEINDHPESVLFSKGDSLSAKDIFDAAKSGDEYACKIVERSVRYLGIALSNIASVCDPQLFLIGGGVAAAGNIIIEGAKKYYDEYSLKALKNKEIVLAELGNDAGMLGCIRLAGAE